jgi:RNA polymerase sigma factor (sigma-70 family)
LKSINKIELFNLIKKHQGIIHKVNSIYFKHKVDREDNFQEVIYQIFKSYDSLRDKKKVTSWIYKVSINTAITALRKNNRVKTKPEFADSDIIEINETNPEEFNEKTNYLYTAIDELSEIEKAIILLYLEEKSYNEIGEIIGISKNNVGIKISRIKEKLKNTLKNKNYGQE